MTARALSELQIWFEAAVAGPEGLPNRDRVERVVQPGPSLSPLECLQIYRDGYLARLTECLADDYPALAHALGDATFASLAREYIRHTPSTSPSLNAYGEHLPAFCRSRVEPWAAFAYDLSRLEWALVEAVHSRAPATLSGEALAAVPPEAWQAARLVPSPALRVLVFEHPVGEYFQQFCDEAAPSIPARRRSATAVCRQALTLWRVELTPTAMALLEEFVAGVPLGAALARLEQRIENPAERGSLEKDLTAWLGSWVSSGFFTAIELGSIGVTP